MSLGYTSSKKSLAVELVAVTASILVLTRIIFLARGIPIVNTLLPLVVAVLFLYVPVLALWRRGRRENFLDRDLRSYIRSLITFLLAAIIVFPPFFLLAHGWQIVVFGQHGFDLAGFPGFWNALAFQLLLVALPEEFYFRGYVQSTMDEILPKKWQLLGVRLGWGWVITAAVFAVAHTVVTYKWWHFSIFFPALLFGYLKERTGTITAPILFHTASNLLMNWFARSYY